MRHALSSLLLLSTALVCVPACKGDEGKAGEDKDKKSAKDGALALTSPTLCEHVKELGYGKLTDEQGCIMRLDGLQIQLGKEDWKAHGKCIADAASTEAVETCLHAADEASLAKAKAAGG